MQQTLELMSLALTHVQPGFSLVPREPSFFCTKIWFQKLPGSHCHPGEMAWRQNQFPISGIAAVDFITLMFTQGWVTKRVKESQRWQKRQ
jgi:hypothetical protein